MNFSYVLDTKNKTDQELADYIIKCKLIRTSWIDAIIEEITLRSIFSDKLDDLKNEINWRSDAREEVLNQTFGRKSSWGLVPSLAYKTNWVVPVNQFIELVFYVMFIMFWTPGLNYFDERSVTIERPDAIDGKSNSKIKVKLSGSGKVEIKCIATGDAIFDNTRNIESLMLFSKAFRLVAKRQGIILSN